MTANLVVVAYYALWPLAVAAVAYVVIRRSYGGEE